MASDDRPHPAARDPRHFNRFDEVLALFKHLLQSSSYTRKSEIHAGMLAMADREVIEDANDRVINALACGERVWMTSDLHFNHAKIIGYCDRPYFSVEDMNAELLRLLTKVAPAELLILVGDMAMGEFEGGLAKIRQMPGRKILVLGNHDLDRSGRCRLSGQRDDAGNPLFDAIVPFLFWPGPPGREVVVTHYPLVLPEGYRGLPILNYHGHLHRDVLAPTQQVKYMNVGWDVSYTLNCL